jgi:hypothetical protein
MSLLSWARDAVVSGVGGEHKQEIAVWSKREGEMRRVLCCGRTILLVTTEVGHQAVLGPQLCLDARHDCAAERVGNQLRPGPRR